MEKQKIKIKDLKPGMKIRFPENYEIIIRNSAIVIGNEDGVVLEIDNEIVTRLDKKEIHIKLEFHHEELDDWNNTIIRNSDDSEFEDEVILLKEPELKEISKLADVELEENDENDNIEEIKTFLSKNYTYNSGGTADWSVENWRIGDLFYNTDKNYGIFVVLDDNNTFAIVRRDGNEDGYDDTQLKTDIFTIEVLILAIKNSIKSEENDGKTKEMIIDKEELPREEILNSVQIDKIRDILQAFVKETTDTILAGALSPHIKKLVVTEVNEVQEIINKLQNVETLK